MRTIKFRGKRIDNKEWVYGYLYELPLPSGDACMILTQDNNHLDNSLEPKYHLAFTLWVDLFLVDPATVGQFTGLTDKNGKEIYEGDIIKFYDMDTYCINPDCEPHLLCYGSCLVKREEVVVFDDGVFGIDDEFHPIRDLMSCGFCDFDLEDLKNYENDPYFDNNGYDMDSIIGVEVIGNIHDNPELKKGGQDERD